MSAGAENEHSAQHVHAKRSAMGEVLQPSDQVRAGEPAEVADRIDCRNAGRCGAPARGSPSAGSRTTARTSSVRRRQSSGRCIAAVVSSRQARCRQAQRAHQHRQAVCQRRSRWRSPLRPTNIITTIATPYGIAVSSPMWKTSADAGGLNQRRQPESEPVVADDRGEVDQAMRQSRRSAASAPSDGCTGAAAWSRARFSSSSVFSASVSHSPISTPLSR